MTEFNLSKKITEVKINDRVVDAFLKPNDVKLLGWFPGES